MTHYVVICVFNEVIVPWEKSRNPHTFVVLGSLIPLIWWVYGGDLLLDDVKYVDVNTIEPLIPLIIYFESFDLGTYGEGNILFGTFMCGIFEFLDKLNNLSILYQEFSNKKIIGRYT